MAYFYLKRLIGTPWLGLKFYMVQCTKIIVVPSFIAMLTIGLNDWLYVIFDPTVYCALR